MKHIILLSIFIISFTIQSFGQIPSGYYDSAEGLTGTELQQALHDIIDNHTVLSYNSLWSAFHDTDPRPENSNLVYDMYSDNPTGAAYTYTFGTNQCGTYHSEGDCYNREHSWPQSWFNKKNPMKTDLMHIIPTDGYVNNKRSSYAYGEVNYPTWTSSNGSKLGNSSANWTNGQKVFEPIDEYKGDIARIYFYMSTRYLGEDGSWKSNIMVNKSQLKPGALAMLLQWHNNDPVSEKEINRNNAVYNWQHNRNPFVDHPEFVEQIWGNPNAVFETEIKQSVVVYPNPAHDLIKITAPETSAKGYKIVIYDYCGKKIHETKTQEQKTDLNLSDLESGIYILRIENLSTDKPMTCKLIKQ